MMENQCLLRLVRYMTNLCIKFHIDTCIKSYYMYVTILTDDGKPMFTKVLCQNYVLNFTLTCALSYITCIWLY
jgi:hypothetical protein